MVCRVQSADEMRTSHSKPGEPGEPGKESNGRASTIVARMMMVFSHVEPGEVASTLLLTLDVFLLLLAYYLLKTVREPLILSGGNLTIGSFVIGPAELKSYSAVGQAVLLILMAKGYASLARRLGRMMLSTVVLCFFAVNLAVFFVLARMGVPVGVPFFLWVGCFSLTVIAQFWSFANDIYTPEQGKRLFAIIGVGSSLGAVFGARIAQSIFEPVGPYGMMLLAGAALLLSLGLTRIVHGMRPAHGHGEENGKDEHKDAPPGTKEGLSLLFKDRYLLLLAALILVLNWVNTTGEYILDRILVDAARAQGDQSDKAVQTFIATFKGDYFFWVNLIGLALQLFFVSRIVKYLGVRIAILFLPAIALGGYLAIAFVPILAVIRVIKIGENSVDYSIQNTARQALFLPTSREAKYTGKAAIDTFVARLGDVMSAAVVAAGSALSFQTKHFAMVNVVLAGAWLAIAYAVGRHYAALSKENPPGKDQPETKAPPPGKAEPALQGNSGHLSPVAQR